MCANCLSNVDAVAASGLFAVAAGTGQARQWLTRMGFRRPDPLAREARTVEFLRGLDLDPAEVLGAQVVEAVDGARTGVEPDAPGGWIQRVRAGSRSSSRGPSLAAAR